MADPIIKVKNLYKRYRIGAREKGYKTFRETIMEGLSAPVRNLGRLRSLTSFKEGDEANVIWVLKDVSFEVKEGEVLGIIGRNGAGKTTLLKILSRITEPTRGTAELYGRVSSLLEVGTGFHPELTGRENIFLNGAILGMRKQEIERKFDEIVAFSEIGPYIDTPVKRYSSGMYVRLAFAVAAHLEPEILLVDEVLAVGDLGFQKKCLGKMGDIAKGGRTVLLVSHHMASIRILCKNALWIDNGQIIKSGGAEEVVANYEENLLSRFNENSYIVERNPEEVKKSDFYISRLEMLDENGRPTTIFKYNDILSLIVEYSGKPVGEQYCVEYRLYNEYGQLVSAGKSRDYHNIYFDKKVKKIKIDIGPLILTKGRYMISLRTHGVSATLVTTDNWENAIGFTIAECQPFRRGWDIPLADEGACIIQHSFSEFE
jgi:lipopolysaccharide transport system ATP-binding protein